ncbi:MAG TPA: hypothetical protein VJI66_02900 [Candidatus Paceibacterota bacterium]
MEYREILKGRMQSSIALRAKRMIRENKVFDEARKEFNSLMKDHFFTLGLALYWAKGSQKGNYLQFTTSSREMVLFMHKWIKKYIKIDENLIKQKNYASYSRIYITRIDVLRKVIAWQKLIIKYYSDK